MSFVRWFEMLKINILNTSPLWAFATINSLGPTIMVNDVESTLVRGFVCIQLPNLISNRIAKNVLSRVNVLSLNFI